MKRCSVIDIGTNSLLYLMTERSDAGNINPIYQELYNVRLGKGLGKNKKIEDATLNHCIRILHKLKHLAVKQKAEKLIVTGTEVFRKAENREQSLHRIETETGLKVRILSHQEEAEASFLGAVKRNMIKEECWVADVGGGSSEIIFGQDYQVIDYISFPLGAVSLTEEFFNTDPPSPGEISSLQNKVISDFRKSALPGWIPPRILIGVGGTITTTAAIYYKLKQYDPNIIQGKVLKFSHIDALLERLGRVSEKERKKIINFDPQRADIIIAGMIIVRSIMELGNFNSIIISDSGLRFGLAVQELTS